MVKNKRVKPKRKVRVALTNARVARALKLAGGRVGDAAEIVGRTQGRVSQMISASTYLQKVRSEEIEELYRLAKLGLKKLILKGDNASCIFACKCLGKADGFTERSEVVGVHTNVPSGVLLLPQPANDLDSWERLASQWNSQRQLSYDGNADVADYDEE